MKKLTILGTVVLLALIVFVVIRNDTSTVEQENQKNVVATTIFPLYDITQQVAGDKFEVVLMLPPGASPHTFDPQPSLLKDLQGSQAIFAIGHGLDDWTTVVAESINAPIVTVDGDINLRESEESHKEHFDEEGSEHHHEDENMDDGTHEEHEHELKDKHADVHKENTDAHEGHDHGPVDPHYWLSLNNAKQITMNIANELSELDPENASTYITRAEAYVEKIVALEIETKDTTESILNKNIISLHDAWYYFAEDFELNLVGTFEPSAGKEPTPQYIISLQEEIADHDVLVLFIEPQLSQSSIKSFADDNNLGIAIIDPLGGVDGRNTYLELMRYNIYQVADALAQ